MQANFLSQMSFMQPPMEPAYPQGRRDSIMSNTSQPELNGMFVPFNGKPDALAQYTFPPVNSRRDSIASCQDANEVNAPSLVAERRNSSNFTGSPIMMSPAHAVNPAGKRGSGEQPLNSSILNAMKVYVRHLGSSITDEDITKFANNFGPIRKIERQRERGGTSHCCYITFELPTDAQNCVRLSNGSTYFANISAERGESAHLPPLSVRMAESLEERHNRLTRRTQPAQNQAPPPPPPPPYSPPMAPPTFVQPFQVMPFAQGNPNVVFVVMPPQ